MIEARHVPKRVLLSAVSAMLAASGGVPRERPRCGSVTRRGVRLRARLIKTL